MNTQLSDKEPPRQILYTREWRCDRYIDNLKETSMMTYLRRKKENITDRILRSDGRHFCLELILAQFPHRNWIVRNWETVC